MGSKNSAVTSTGVSARNTLSIIGGGIFLKPFKTIDEQIALLKQRGLRISDECAELLAERKARSASEDGSAKRA